MKYLSASTGSDWVDIELKLVNQEGTKGDPKRIAIDSFRRHLLDILNSENLLVLSGLGTSLAAKDAKGVNIAPSMQDLWDKVKNATGKDFDQVKIKVKYTPGATGDSIESLLSRCQISERMSTDSQVHMFIEQAEIVIRDACSFVDKDTKIAPHEAFLRKVARRPVDKPRMKLFTTNYDLCFEEAARRNRFAIIDGFSGAIPQEFDGVFFEYDIVRRLPEESKFEFVPNVFQLNKLHGSVNWGSENNRILKMDKPKKPVLIYPRDTKYELSYDQPYLESMARFQSALRGANLGFLITGFGFNDSHIAQPILSAIGNNISLKAMIVNKNIQAVTNPIVQKLVDLVKEGDWRISLAETTFEEFVEVIPDLAKDTEEEAFQRRLKKAGL